MGPKTTRLLAFLDEASQLLRGVEEDHWARWLERDAAALRGGDFHGVEHFLRAFGGMGSINDLVIHPLNGHRVTEQDVAAVNERLVQLLGDAWELARAITRDHQIG